MECGTSEVPYDPLAMKSFGNREIGQIASRWADISVGHALNTQLSSGQCRSGYFP
ncbi:hypothetical protein DAPPUDRAFT_246477 [Daphnia pulex]|uniref:Uncharacterized protein n=1 Tax=Daphnia pulex TaxID=6669 RepID=E9GQL8_DAPPU|nr:hypothetical protein DAPPUDRAFT_246477 [Daphnia pulex]|eukprot:EFX78133.1 hypothetical protein DAPPUDRAFT_246477 [Daphnia pulex]